MEMIFNGFTEEQIQNGDLTKEEYISVLRDIDGKLSNLKETKSNFDMTAFEEKFEATRRGWSNAVNQLYMVEGLGKEKYDAQRGRGQFDKLVEQRDVAAEAWTAIQQEREDYQNIDEDIEFLENLTIYVKEVGGINEVELSAPIQEPAKETEGQEILNEVKEELDLDVMMEENQIIHTNVDTKFMEDEKADDSDWYDDWLDDDEKAIHNDKEHETVETPAELEDIELPTIESANAPVSEAVNEQVEPKEGYAFSEDGYEMPTWNGMIEDDIRDNFDRALSMAEKGTDLSDILGYDLGVNDFTELARLHSMGMHQYKIEELLEDCDFNEELDAFRHGKYAEFGIESATVQDNIEQKVEEPVVEEKEELLDDDEIFADYVPEEDEIPDWVQEADDITEEPVEEGKSPDQEESKEEDFGEFDDTVPVFDEPIEKAISEDKVQEDEIPEEFLRETDESKSEERNDGQENGQSGKDWWKEHRETLKEPHYDDDVEIVGPDYFNDSAMLEPYEEYDGISEFGLGEDFNLADYFKKSQELDDPTLEELFDFTTASGDYKELKDYENANFKAFGLYASKMKEFNKFEEDFKNALTKSSIKQEFEKMEIKSTYAQYLKEKTDIIPKLSALAQKWTGKSEKESTTADVLPNNWIGKKAWEVIKEMETKALGSKISEYVSVKKDNTIKLNPELAKMKVSDVDEKTLEKLSYIQGDLFKDMKTAMQCCVEMSNIKTNEFGALNQYKMYCKELVDQIRQRKAAEKSAQIPAKEIKEQPQEVKELMKKMAHVDKMKEELRGVTDWAERKRMTGEIKKLQDAIAKDYRNIAHQKEKDGKDEI